MDIGTLINAASKLQRQVVATHIAFVNVCAAISYCSDDIEHPPIELASSVTYLDRFLKKRERQLKRIVKATNGVHLMKVEE